VNSADLPYFNAVSEAYKEITGIEAVPIHRTPEGAFFQFGYFQFGVPSFSTPGWGLPAGAAQAEEGAEEADAPQAGARTPPAGERMAGGAPPRGMGARPGMGGMAQSRGRTSTGGDGIDAQLLEALESAGVDAFADWEVFNHPTLGEAEIGGFLPYVTANPPAEEVSELGAQHGEFLVKLAGMLPRVHIADTEVKAHGGGVFSVTVEVENEGFLPTSLRHGQISRSVQPTTVQIQVPQEDILTGADKTSRITVLDGSGAREKFTWVIRGREGSQVEIKLRAQKGGTDSATVTLR